MSATGGHGIDLGSIGDIFAKDYRWGDCSQDFRATSAIHYYPH